MRVDGIYAICAILIILIIGMLLGWIPIGWGSSAKQINNERCWPVAFSSSTGTIRCWSGGQLVYQNSIYHNGGVLCSVDGKAIKITGGKSLCVIESNQDSVWNPPTN